VLLEEFPLKENLYNGLTWEDVRNPEKLGFFYKLEKNRPSGFDTEERCFHWTVALQMADHIHCYRCL